MADRREMCKERKGKRRRENVAWFDDEEYVGDGKLCTTNLVKLSL